MSTSLGYSREFLQSLALARLKDAETLLTASRWSAAYYLAGYAIELGLKACISRQIRAETLPDPKFVNKVYVHNFEELVRLAGLGQLLREEQRADPDFASNWALVSQWNESARYQEHDKSTAQQFLIALSDDKHGVLRWLKTYW